MKPLDRKTTKGQLMEFRNRFSILHGPLVLSVLGGLHVESTDQIDLEIWFECDNVPSNTGLRKQV